MKNRQSFGTISDPVFDDLLAAHSKQTSNLWSISWADIMMTMFILFVVLYLYKTHGQNIHLDSTAPKFPIAEAIETGSSNSVPLPFHVKPKARFKQAAIENLLEGEQISLADDQAVRFALPGDLLFDLGKADIKHEAIQQLKQIGTILKSNDYVVNVVGHTDNIPSTSLQYPSNWELSTARACRVARFLIAVSGVPEDRFFVSGQSHLNPLRPNTTARNRSLNRRVEIILMKEMPYAEVFSGYTP
jgi:chemotaxis protein MotB